MQILLMDNSITDAEVLRAMLIKVPGQQCTIRQAETLADGLTELRQVHYDVALMSLDLPGGNGLAGVLSVREQVRHLAIILLIAANQEELALQALDLGSRTTSSAARSAAACWGEPRSHAADTPCQGTAGE